MCKIVGTPFYSSIRDHPELLISFPPLFFISSLVEDRCFRNSYHEWANNPDNNYKLGILIFRSKHPVLLSLLWPVYHKRCIFFGRSFFPPYLFFNKKIRRDLRLIFTYLLENKQKSAAAANNNKR